MVDLKELLGIAALEDEEIVESSENKRSKHYNSVVRFIRKKQIKSGKIRVPVYRLIYSYYIEFSPTEGKKASRIEFGRIFKLYFERSRSGKYRYYMLDDFCDMSKETMDKAKEYYKRYHLRKRNVKNKKK